MPSQRCDIHRGLEFHNLVFVIASIVVVLSTLLLVSCDNRPVVDTSSEVSATTTAIPNTINPQHLMAAYVKLSGPNETYFLVLDQDLYRTIHRDLDQRNTQSLNDAILRGDTLPVRHGQRILILNLDRDRRPDAAWVEISDGPHIGRRGWLPWKFTS